MDHPQEQTNGEYMEVADRAATAATDVIDEQDEHFGLVVIITVPPDYKGVRYRSNLKPDQIPSLLDATSSYIVQQQNGSD